MCMWHKWHLCHGLSLMFLGGFWSIFPPPHIFASSNIKMFNKSLPVIWALWWLILNIVGRKSAHSREVCEFYCDLSACSFCSAAGGAGWPVQTSRPPRVQRSERSHLFWYRVSHGSPPPSHHAVAALRTTFHARIIFQLVRLPLFFCFQTFVVLKKIVVCRSFSIFT